ncbi:MAG TPA: hypothetical protein VHB21_02660, partial [Minicystis sp.]|nr:hypothetical protein [Minicystis sp.]
MHRPSSSPTSRGSRGHWLALGVGACAGLGLAVLANAALPESPIVRGLRVGGEPVPAHGSAAS